MKCVFLRSAALLIVFLVLSGCTIPSAIFTFINNSGEVVIVTPASGQIWQGFTLANGQTKIIESESSNIYFTAVKNGALINLDSNFTYTSSTRTYNFM